MTSAAARGLLRGMAARGVLRTVQGGRVAFWCPGCKEMHQIRVEGDLRPCWGFSGDYDKPTFDPSILVTSTARLTDEEVDRVMAGEKLERKPTVCHSFVRAGRIEFLSDCTHELAGTTVDLEVPAVDAD